MQNEERPDKATSCDINATPRRVDSQLIATLMRPQGSHKAPAERQQSHLGANVEGRMQNEEGEAEGGTRTSNAEHPTSNIQPPAKEVGSSLWPVFHDRRK